MNGNFATSSCPETGVSGQELMRQGWRNQTSNVIGQLFPDLFVGGPSAVLAVLEVQLCSSKTLRLDLGKNLTNYGLKETSQHKVLTS